MSDGKKDILFWDFRKKKYGQQILQERSIMIFVEKTILLYASANKLNGVTTIKIITYLSHINVNILLLSICFPSNQLALIISYE